MARKKRVSLGGKNFFTIVVLSAVAIGILFTANVAMQQQTSTRSEAACNRNPNIQRIGTVGKAKSVVYKFKITTNCSGTRGYRFKMISVPSKHPFGGGSKGWSWRWADGEWNKTYIRKGVYGGTTYINLEIKRPDNRTGTSGYVERPIPGTYKPFVIEVSHRLHPERYDRTNLTYVIE